LATTILRQTADTSIAGPASPSPPTQPATVNDHELSADNFAEALVPPASLPAAIAALRQQAQEIGIRYSVFRI
jgi:hypothetical protein